MQKLERPFQVIGPDATLAQIDQPMEEDAATLVDGFVAAFGLADRLQRQGPDTGGRITVQACG